MELNKWKLFEKIGYCVFHKRIQDFHNSKARIKICVCPRRSSKSYSAAHDVIDILLKPNTRVWVVGPNYDLASREFAYIRNVFVNQRMLLGIPKLKTDVYEPREGRLHFETRWGSICEGKSCKNKSTLLGQAVDVVIYSEAAQIKSDVRDYYVAPSLITRKGYEIIPTTYEEGLNCKWIDELIDRSVKDEDIEFFTWGIEANPEYKVEELIRAKNFYGEDSTVFQEQYLGKRVNKDIVFTFKAEDHIVTPFEIPSFWKIYRGIDFGYRNPFCCIWIAEDPEGRYYVFDEYYNKEKGIRIHAQEIKRRHPNNRVILTVADPESPQSIEDLSVEGIPTIKGFNEIRGGVARMNDCLVKRIHEPNRNCDAKPNVEGKYPVFYVFSNVVTIIKEFAYCRWTGERKIENNHGLDAIRYVINEIYSPTTIRTVNKPLNAMTPIGYINSIKNKLFHKI